jgi:hypothetical protein
MLKLINWYKSKQWKLEEHVKIRTNYCFSCNNSNHVNNYYHQVTNHNVLPSILAWRSGECCTGFGEMPSLAAEGGTVMTSNDSGEGTR